MIGKIIFTFLSIILFMTAIFFKADIKVNRRKYSYDSRLVRIAAMIISFILAIIFLFIACKSNEL